MSAPDPGLHSIKEDIEYITRNNVINDQTLRELGNTEVDEHIDPHDFIFTEIYPLYIEFLKEENIFYNVVNLINFGDIENISFGIFELKNIKKFHTKKYSKFK
jgi:hypothetical protein